MRSRDPSFCRFAASRFRPLEGGGAKGIRTPDLLIANETLYQLSYSPNVLWEPHYGSTEVLGNRKEHSR
jgi:hypothetical protein